MKKPLLKKIPDMLTWGRVVLSLVLLPVKLGGAAFFTIYVICGVTDILDGYLARNFGVAGEKGAKLDSFADGILTAVMIIKLWGILTASKFILALAVLTAAAKLSAAATAKLRFGVFGFAHTYLNKLTGFLLFLYPLTLVFSSAPGMLLIPGIPAAFAAAEDTAIAVSAKYWDSDRRGFFYDLGKKPERTTENERERE